MGRNSALINTAHDFLDGALCHSSKSWYTPLRKSKAREPYSVFNKYKLDIAWHDCHFDQASPLRADNNHIKEQAYI